MGAEVVLRKTSLVDFPGRIAATVFFRGCNLRCPWCHNRELVSDGREHPAPGTELVTLATVAEFLVRRRLVLGGVVISGGEPLLFAGLGSFIEEIKEIGLPVKLDTNGTLPDRLEELLASESTRPDYIAVDLKLAPRRYREIGGSASAAEAVARTAAMVAASGIEHEFRSLALPGGWFGDADLQELAPFAGKSKWYFAPFSPGNCLDPTWDELGAATKADTEELIRLAENLGANAQARGA